MGNSVMQQIAPRRSQVTRSLRGAGRRRNLGGDSQPWEDPTMPTLQHFAAGSYRFIPYAFQYSGGVVADPGFVIERARFRRPVPLADGFAALEAHLKSLGRPPTALCAAELRSPGQFTEAGFI